MANKLVTIIVLATVLVLSGISSANALNVTNITANWASGFPDGFINQNEQIRLNITLWTNNSDGIHNYSYGAGTLNNTAPRNITQVSFTFAAGATYSVAQNPNGSNDTSLVGWVFANTSNSATWTYPATPTATRFTNESSHSFLFNITAANAGDTLQLISMN